MHCRVNNSTKVTPPDDSALKQLWQTVMNFFTSPEMKSQVIGSDVQLVYPITVRHSAAEGGPTNRDVSHWDKYFELAGAT